MRSLTEYRSVSNMLKPATGRVEKTCNTRLIKRITRKAHSYKDVVNSLPDDIRSKLVFSRETYAKSYALTKWFMVYGLSVLTRHELSLLLFFMSRTVQFGKCAEMITKEHFLRGVHSGDELVCSPVKMNPNDLYQTIREMERKGYIFVHPVSLNGRKLPTIYEIAIDFIVSTRPNEAFMGKLRIPKSQKTADILDFEAFRRAKMGQLDGTKPYHQTDAEMVRNRTINIYKEKEEDNELVATPAAGNESKLRVRRKPRPAVEQKPKEIEIDCKAKIRKVIEVASTRSTNKMLEKAARAGAGFITPSAINATWKKCMVEQYGHCTIVGLTQKECAIFKKVSKTHELSCTWEEFFTWVISNWRIINQESREYADYKKKKTGDWSLKQENVFFLGTDTPDISAMVRNFGKLAKRYAQKELATKSQVSAPGQREQLLEAQLAEAKRLQSSTSALLKKAMAAKSADEVPKRREVKETKMVDPATDTYFDNEQSLPEWDK